MKKEVKEEHIPRKWRAAASSSPLFEEALEKNKIKVPHSGFLNKHTLVPQTSAVSPLL